MKNNKLIEWVFKHEDAIRQAVNDTKEDDGITRRKQGGRRSTFSPVEAEVCRKLSELPAVEVRTEGEPSFTLRRPEVWIRLIEKVRRKYDGTVYGQIYDLRYRQNKTTEEIYNEIGLSRAGYYLLSNELLSYAEGAASMAGLT